MKRYWPVLYSYSKKVPIGTEHGAFKREDYFIDRRYRKIDIFHSGIDIFCPLGSKVIAAEDCKIVRAWKFTGPPDAPEYRNTWAITVKNDTGNIIVYGEVKKPKVKVCQNIKAGSTIGFIAQVEHNGNEPVKTRRCMLHFELYKKGTRKTVDWWCRKQKKPKNLLNPTSYLKKC